MSERVSLWQSVLSFTVSTPHWCIKVWVPVGGYPGHCLEDNLGISMHLWLSLCHYINMGSILTFCQCFLVWFMSHRKDLALSHSVKKAKSRHLSTSLCAVNRCRRFAFLSNEGTSEGLGQSPDQLVHWCIVVICSAEGAMAWGLYSPMAEIQSANIRLLINCLAIFVISPKTLIQTGIPKQSSPGLFLDLTMFMYFCTGNQFLFLLFNYYLFL